MRIVIPAHEVEVGDVIIGPANGDPFVYPLPVGRIADYRRGGARLGSRFHSTTPRTLGSYDARADARLVVDRP